MLRRSDYSMKLRPICGWWYWILPFESSRRRPRNAFPRAGGLGATGSVRLSQSIESVVVAIGAGGAGVAGGPRQAADRKVENRFEYQARHSVIHVESLLRNLQMALPEIIAEVKTFPKRRGNFKLTRILYALFDVFGPVVESAELSDPENDSNWVENRSSAPSSEIVAVGGADGRTRRPRRRGTDATAHAGSGFAGCGGATPRAPPKKVVVDDKNQPPKKPTTKKKTATKSTKPSTSATTTKPSTTPSSQLPAQPPQTQPQL